MAAPWWHTCQTSACLRLPCVALWLPQTRFHEDHEEVEWSNGDERVIVVMIVVAVVSVLEVVLCGGGVCVCVMCAALSCVCTCAHVGLWVINYLSFGYLSG